MKIMSSLRSIVFLLWFARPLCGTVLDCRPRDHSHYSSETRLVRPATEGIHEQEYNYRMDRRDSEVQALRWFLERADAGLDPQDYDDSVLGLAFSGGGFRAMLTGAGEFAALDNRTEHSSNYSLGGLVQAASYMTGLSGGSWLVGTFLFNGFPTVDWIVENKNLWRLDLPLIASGGIVQSYRQLRAYAEILWEVQRKKAAGYPITVTDIWGRILFRKLVDHTGNGGITNWSQIRNEDWFLKRAAPWPIVVLNGRNPPSRRDTLWSPIYEISPYEIGSWDDDPEAFANLKYLGSEYVDDELKIVRGYDNAGFILGACSSLFDQVVVEALDGLTGSSDLANSIRRYMGDSSVMEFKDLAIVHPNPFYNFTGPWSSDYLQRPTPKAETLYLADGGGNKMGIPLQPHLEPSRKVDCVLAFDNGGTSLYNPWPDGMALVKTYERQFNLKNSPSVPYLPDAATFVNLGLANRPVFFGCAARNLTGLKSRNGLDSNRPPPVVVYIPNQPMSYKSNVSTFKMDFTEGQMAKLIKNGYHIATQGNGTIDSDWQACVACALTQRSRERRNIALPEKCADCFEKYCWNGELDPDIEKARTNGPSREIKL